MTAYLLDGLRTPLGRLNGGLSGLTSVELGARVLKELAARYPRLPVDRVVLGSVLQAGAGQNVAHQVARRAGVHATAPATTVNDVCLAGISTIGLASDWIGTGRFRAVVVGGIESMSTAPRVLPVGASADDGPRRPAFELDGLIDASTGLVMGELSDRENARLGISRLEQDELAAISHRRAAAAATSGSFNQELIPIETPEGTVQADECIRPGTTAERLSDLKPAFTADGTITAGNASQLSDAASLGFVVSEEVAQAVGIEPLAEVVDYAMYADADPSLHLKPALAAEALLAKAGLRPSEVDLWEINEAFAGVVIASMKRLGLDLENVNVNGGAIALGHPFAATALRMVLTLAREMRRRGVRTGVATLCGGGGQGAAVLLRRGLPGT